MLNPQQIKQALVTLAERKQRDYYTPMVVRDVIDAFARARPHFLKEEVLHLIRYCPKEYVARFDEISKLCRNDNDINNLALASGVPYVVVRGVVKGTHDISDKLWEQLSRHFEGIEGE